MSFEHGFFDELEKIAEGPALKVVGPGRIERAAYRAGLSTGRAQMKKAVRALNDKRPFYANPLAAAALGAGGFYLGSRLLRSRRDEE